MADDDRTASEIRDDDIEISTGRLRDDIRDALLTHVRSMEEPWSKLSEQKQQWRIEAVTRTAEELVRRCAYLMASAGFDSIPIQVGKFQVDEQIKAVVQAAPNDFNVSGFLMFKGKPAILVLCDPAEWMGEHSEVHADPDQPDLKLDETGEGEGELDDDDEQTIDPSTDKFPPEDIRQPPPKRAPAEAPATALS